MKFIAIQTEDGKDTGKISLYCRTLDVTRQAFYDYLARKNRPWKYEILAEEMVKIHEEDKYNDAYGRGRMYLALLLKKEVGEISVHIPSEGTVRKVMERIGLIHEPRRKPNGITKAEREAHKSDDLLKRDFSSEKPLEKAVTDISELKAKDGKIYVSAIFDCYDLMPLGFALKIICVLHFAAVLLKMRRWHILISKAAFCIRTEEVSIQVQNIVKNCKNMV